MSDSTRVRGLQVALVISGVLFIFAVFPLMQVWPAGWRWNPNQTKYEQMIIGIYATLGVFLLIAAANPLAHRSLIWFTVWSSVVHGGIMAAQALGDRYERCHLIGDIPALFLIAAALAFLMPRRAVVS